MRRPLNHHVEQRETEFSAAPVQYAPADQNSIDESLSSSTSDSPYTSLTFPEATQENQQTNRMPRSRDDNILNTSPTPAEANIPHSGDATDIEGTEAACTGHEPCLLDTSAQADANNNDLDHDLQAAGKVIADTHCGISNEAALSLLQPQGQFLQGPSMTYVSVHTHHHHYYQETCSQLAVNNTRDPIFSHEELDKIAGFLDHVGEWKMLASKLGFDSSIDQAERLATNERTSPTMKMLKLWMQSREASRDRLEKALTSMVRVDILDELGFKQSTDL